MPHIKYKQLADEIIYGNWGREAESSHELARTGGNEIWNTALLIDIAESLRVLRCQNFKDIPHKLDVIRRNTTKKKRKVIKP